MNPPSRRTGPRHNRLPSYNNNNNNHGIEEMSSTTKARLALLGVCLWPLLVLAMYEASVSSSSGNINASPTTKGVQQVMSESSESIRNLLDRVDIVGYGPTHPRFGMMVVGTDTLLIQESVESIFRHTDLNRLFMVCVQVVGGERTETQKSQWISTLESFEQGHNIPHWHGGQEHVHDTPHEKKNDSNSGDDGSDESDESEDEEEDEEEVHENGKSHHHHHSKKIHIMWTDEEQNGGGINEGRHQCADFLHILSNKHEEAKMKSPQEDLLLVLLEQGAVLQNTDWMTPVTQALIVPPPILSQEDTAVAMKLANAVSFVPSSGGTSEFLSLPRTTFNYQLERTISQAKGKDLTESNGDSYTTPVLEGLATAMRLNTFLQLPSQDTFIMMDDDDDTWYSNLELSMNLWLCADGIDVLTNVHIGVSSTKQRQRKEEQQQMLSVEQAARFVASWIPSSSPYGDVIYQQFHHPQQQQQQQQHGDVVGNNSFSEEKKVGITRTEWDVLIASSKQTPTFAQGLQTKCRPFEWYAESIHSELQSPTKVLKELALVEEEEKRKQKQQQQTEKDKDTVDTQRKDTQKEKEKKAIFPKEEKKGATVTADNKSNDKDLSSSEQGDDDQNLDVPPPLQNNNMKLPSKSLSDANLAIIGKATPEDISYVDLISNKLPADLEHPHKGAQDEKGNWGYVYDETSLRQNPPPFQYDKLKKACKNHDAHYQMLTKKVFVDLEAHDAKEASGVKRDKIFCLVYTISSNHAAIPFIRETWGPKCDGFMVASNETDPVLGTVNIPHEGPEEYNNIWQKVRSMWTYIYDHYYDKYDWFHIGGDDLYLLVENLRLYLESEEIQLAQNGGIHLPNGNETEQTPLFLGRRFAMNGNRKDIFISGGSGYTMNKAALKILVVKGLPKFMPHAKTFSEDSMIAKVFRRFGVEPYDTKDENGGERYMPFMPGHHLNYRMPKDIASDWYATYSIDIKMGLDHCAARSVAFHYVKDQSQKRLHAILYHLCPGDNKAKEINI